jgi:HlyD family secretion protein
MTCSSQVWPLLTAATVAILVGGGAHLAASSSVLDLQQWATFVLPVQAEEVVGEGDNPGHAKQAKARTVLAANEWVVAAPGRVEPASGEVRLGASVLGRVAEISIEEGSHVEAGDLLIRLDDDEVEARAAALEADVQVRLRDRDDVDATSRAAREMRSAEDAVAAAERQFWKRRSMLDRLTASYRSGATTAEELAKARGEKVAAEAALAKADAELERLRADPDSPLPTRAESALSAARAERSALEALREKSRIRAPFAGVVLRLDAKAGEIVAPSPELALVVVGDTAKLRVRAEVDDRDAGKVRLGQVVDITTGSFAGKVFQGKVSRIAPALSTPKLGSRGVLKRTDVDILEVLIDLDPAPELLPGMRVDALIKDNKPS